jgi:exodeoxyribonuclease VII large subunit
MTQPGKIILSVSELTEKIKILLEESYPFIWIQGEISNFKIPASGHFYFTLKDSAAQIGAVMFRGQNRKLTFLPEDGMNVTGFGRLSVFSPRGAYQIILEHLEPSGIGALQAAFEQMKEKLAAEGLFDPVHKKPLPSLPQKIALITSPTGAVVHDMIRVMGRRFPNLHIEIVPASVQGERAAAEIVAALRLINERGDADLAVLARGGGSIEDLWPFNSEQMARAIFSSDVPVVSAVGHETDYTIADFVADRRAPTPSAASEMVVPVKAELLERQSQLTKRLAAALSRLTGERRRRLRQLFDRLIHPRRRIDDLRLRLDELNERMQLAATRTMQLERERTDHRRQRLYASSPRVLLHTRKLHLTRIYDRLRSAFTAELNSRKARWQSLNSQLSVMNPAAVLERGYSITRRKTDRSIIRDSAAVEMGEMLEIMLAKGGISCRVEGREEDGQEKL